MLRNPFRPRLVPADTAPRTLREAQALHGDLRASLYFHRGERFILSAVQDFSEYLEPVVLPADVDDATLGQALLERLLAYSPATPDLRGYTMKDWRALQVSGACSRKQFEAESDFVHVATRNVSLEFSACPRTSADPDLVAGAALVLDATPDEFGATVRKLLRAVQVLRQGGCY